MDKKFSDYIASLGEDADWSKGQRMSFPNLPRNELVVLELSTVMLEELKGLAIQRNMTYQTLIKILLADGIEKVKES